MGRTFVMTLAIAGGLLMAGLSPTAAQQTRIPGGGRVANPGERQFNIALLRPDGGPVVPLFDGWYQNPDGTYNLCFGYFNVNTEEVLELPIGEDNFIEPIEFDGMQPTQFLPVPDGGRRFYCAFTVNVPETFGPDDDVVWTLRSVGVNRSVPGRIKYASYHLEEPMQETRSTVAPTLNLLDRNGPEAMGRTGVTIGHLEANVGNPLSLTVWASRPVNPYRENDTRPIQLWWFKHQGPPGDVTFSEDRIAVPFETLMQSKDGRAATTQVTFSEPGEYTLRVQAYHGFSDFEFQCCLTNAYVQVRVSR